MNTRTEGAAPGTFACHEALHMASVLVGIVEVELVDHASIQDNPEWLKLAEDARDSLTALYQKIGVAHGEASR
ncbi:hypothetical protein [Bradyrhizobium elkanii]|uniref:Uncharacterized protein n=1 Tax=Bradyrhizobium elkanii TaxID=29448 RepID=A0A8I1Y883_BRAEL|nr:hypothetical protein [Bradyrhizobium elkanii]MBP1296644.1 hypothetical protein [Bradyrhizobium elkanii]